MTHDIHNNTDSEESKDNAQAFPPWKIRDALFIMCAGIAGEFIMRHSIEILFFANLDPSESDSMERILQAAKLATLGHLTLLFLMMLLMVIYIVRNYHRVPLADIGWTIQISKVWIYYAFLIGVSFALLEFLIIKNVLNILPPGWKQLGFRTHSAVLGVLIQIIIGSIEAPLVEELFFRGFSYTVFRKRFGITYGIFLSSLIYVLWHYLKVVQAPILSVPIFLGAVIKCMIYEKSRSLVPPIIVHSMSNSVLFACIAFS